jgi:signal transduction histidine kinase
MSVTQRPRVWIVDDSPAQAEIARRSLSHGSEVTVFHDGSSALERLAGDALGSDRPHVLVLDWNMPSLSGLEVCRFVRERLGPSELPILILTGTADQRDLVAAFEAGANDFVRKPFDEGELNARVAGLERSRNLYAQLNAAETHLRDEARFRERFIAALSHDLRQPLTAIKALAEIGRRQSQPRDMRVHDAAVRMSRMLDDVLDLSRSRLGSGMRLRQTSVALDALAERVVDEHRAAAADRTIELTVSGDLTGEWDGDRLAQVFSNLLDNALKHGAADAPVVCELRGLPSHVTMTVRNEGARLSEPTMATLFDAFRQGNPETAGTGLGLGLFIVDQIVRAHGGTVTATNDLGGTTFTVMLPRSPAPSFA